MKFNITLATTIHIRRAVYGKAVDCWADRCVNTMCALDWFRGTAHARIMLDCRRPHISRNCLRCLESEEAVSGNSFAWPRLLGCRKCHHNQSVSADTCIPAEALKRKRVPVNKSNRVRRRVWLLKRDRRVLIEKDSSRSIDRGGRHTANTNTLLPQWRRMNKWTFCCCFGRLHEQDVCIRANQCSSREVVRMWDSHQFLACALQRTQTVTL